MTPFLIYYASGQWSDNALISTIKERTRTHRYKSNRHRNDEIAQCLEAWKLGCLEDFSVLESFEACMLGSHQTKDSPVTSRLFLTCQLISVKFGKNQQNPPTVPFPRSRSDVR